MDLSIRTAARLIALNVADFDNAGHSRRTPHRAPRWALTVSLLLLAAALAVFGIH